MFYILKLFVMIAERPSIKYLARIRSNLLLFLKPLILQQFQFNPRSGQVPSNGEEVDILFNFLSTVGEVITHFP